MTETMDFDVFYETLLRVSRQAFKSIISEHQEEVFYSFGLLHEPLWAYILPICNTEEALLSRAIEYKNKYPEGHGNKSIDKLKTNLRWSSGDWGYTEFGIDIFKPVLTILDDESDYVKERSRDESKAFNEQMIEVLYKVIIRLEQESLFGTGAKRQKIVLNIFMGDQDPIWIRHGQKLNPPDVYNRWLEELREAGLHR